MGELLFEAQPYARMVVMFRNPTDRLYRSVCVRARGEKMLCFFIIVLVLRLLQCSRSSARGRNAPCIGLYAS